VIWSNGKLLGGSSQLNAMMYIRGNVQGFDDMAQKTGDSGWSLKNVLRYYKQMENYQGWFDTGKLDS
jgi:choline dehydrogenase